MSEICGFTFEPGGPSERSAPDDVARMARAAEPSTSGVRVLIGRGAALAVVSAGRHEAGIAERPAEGGERAILAFAGSFFEPAGAGSTRAAALLDRYLREGISFVAGLRGEFALAIWDGRDEVLRLATDRFRIVPTLYLEQDRSLRFASRMRGLLAAPGPPRLTVSPRAVVDVVGSSFVPTPRTIFQEVRKLPAAHVLEFRRGTATRSPYWNLDFRSPARTPEEDLARRVREALGDAVRVRIASDGAERIGSFLSGGVDSSTVTGLLGRLSGRPARSFSIGFEEPRFNEISYARLAAQALGAEHHEYFVTPRDVRSILPDLIDAFDEPFGNASAVPTYYCARLAREHGVDTLYAGDGGDELFAGNERYATWRVFDPYRSLPGWLRDPVLRPMVRAAAERFPLRVLDRARRYVDRASIPYPLCLTSYDFLRTVAPTDLFVDGVLEELGPEYDPGEAVHRLFQEAPARTVLDRQLYLDLKLAISDNDLFKVTRMSELAGVTARFPFLDPAVVEIATRVPASLKMRGLELRTFFKRAYRDLLPPAVRAKKKHGFGLPIATWLRADPELHALMRDLVLGPDAMLRSYLRREGLESLVRAHAMDPTSFYGTALWNLMILELWHRRHRPAAIPLETAASR